MTERKSRIGIDPPDQFFADVITFLSIAYPEAKLTKEDIRELRPHLIRQWRMGQNAARSASATCSCDGRKIVPSPASGLDLRGRIARPPAEIPADMIFGLEDVREPRRVEKARLATMVARRQAEHFSEERNRLEAELSQGELSSKRESQVRRLIARAESMVAKYKLQANQIAAKVRGISVLGGRDRGVTAPELYDAPQESVTAPELPKGKSSVNLRVPTRPKRRTKKTDLEEVNDEVLGVASAESYNPPVESVSTPESLTGNSTVPTRPKRRTKKAGLVEVNDELPAGSRARKRKKPCTECATGPEPLPSEDLNALQGLIDQFADAAISDISKKGT